LSAAKLLTKDEARRIAANVTKVPELFQCDLDIVAALAEHYVQLGDRSGTLKPKCLCVLRSYFGDGRDILV
jgi:hypothetical protein